MKYNILILLSFVLMSMGECAVDSEPALVSFIVKAKDNASLNLLEDMNGRIQDTTIYLKLPSRLSKQTTLLITYSARASHGATIESPKTLDLLKSKVIHIRKKGLLANKKRSYTVLLEFNVQHSVVPTNTRLSTKDNPVIKNAFPTGLKPSKTTDSSVTFTLPSSFADTSPLVLKPSFDLKDMTLVHPTTPQDFAGGRSYPYTFRSKAGDAVIYTVKIEIQKPSGIHAASFSVSDTDNPALKSAFPTGLKPSKTTDDSATFTLPSTFAETSPLLLKPSFELQEMTLVHPTAPQDFAGGRSFPYTFRSKTGETVIYTIAVVIQKPARILSVTLPASDTENSALKTAFSTGLKPSKTTNSSATFTLPSSFAETSPLLLKPSFELQEMTLVHPTAPQDFAGGRSFPYTFRSKAGETVIYTIAVVIQKPARILSVTLPASDTENAALKTAFPTGLKPSKTTDSSATFTLPSTFAETSPLLLKPSFELQEMTLVHPTAPQDFAGGRSLPYTFRSKAGETVIYTIAVVIQKPARILSVTLPASDTENAALKTAFPTGLKPSKTTDSSATFTLPSTFAETSPLMLKPSFELQEMTLVHPTTPQDFAGGRSLPYTFRSKTGETVIYTFTLNIDLPPAITSFIIDPDLNPEITNQLSATITESDTQNTITLPIPANLFFQKSLVLTPTITTVNGTVTTNTRNMEFKKINLIRFEKKGGGIKIYRLILTVEQGFIGIKKLSIDEINVDGIRLLAASRLWKQNVDLSNPAAESFHIELSPEVAELVKTYPVKLNFDFLYNISSVSPPLNSFEALPRTYTFTIGNVLNSGKEETKKVTINTKINAQARPKSIFLLQGTNKFYPAEYNMGRVAVDPWTFDTMEIVLFENQKATWTIQSEAASYTTIANDNNTLKVSWHHRKFNRTQKSDYTNNITLFSVTIIEGENTEKYDFYWLPEPSVYDYGWLPGRTHNAPGTHQFSKTDPWCRNHNNWSITYLLNTCIKKTDTYTKNYFLNDLTTNVKRLSFLNPTAGMSYDELKNAGWYEEHWRIDTHIWNSTESKWVWNPDYSSTIADIKLQYPYVRMTKKSEHEEEWKAFQWVETRKSLLNTQIQKDNTLLSKDILPKYSKYSAYFNQKKGPRNQSYFKNVHTEFQNHLETIKTYLNSNNKLFQNFQHHIVETSYALPQLHTDIRYFPISFKHIKPVSNTIYPYSIRKDPAKTLFTYNWIGTFSTGTSSDVTNYFTKIQAPWYFTRGIVNSKIYTQNTPVRTAQTHYEGNTLIQIRPTPGHLDYYKKHTPDSEYKYYDASLTSTIGGHLPIQISLERTSSYNPPTYPKKNTYIGKETYTPHIQEIFNVPIRQNTFTGTPNNEEVQLYHLEIYSSY